ncbi:MAG: hypothetical protein O6931_01605, partial [Gammaproteobacteria bacterium]|nr:hypothetical protein [Gammaproteobacteria bacterium]
VVAMWSSFAYQAGQELGQRVEGVPAELVREFVELVRDERPIYSLETQFNLIPLASARKLGLPDDWVARLEAHDSKSRQVLSINRTVAGSTASQLLKPGDLLLTIDGQVVSSFREVERLVRQSTVSVEVWRNKQLLEFEIATATLDGRGLDRVVMWAGALLQAPHRAMSVQRGISPDGIYVAFFSYGSPANRYGLWAGRRILAVDEIETPDLDSFISAVSGKKDREAVRLTTATWNNRIEVITLKLDDRYWPAYEITRTDQGWQRSALPATDEERRHAGH